MKILDSSVILLFLHDIHKEKYLHMLSTSEGPLLIPESVYKEVLDEDTRLLMDSMISRGILEKINELDQKEEELTRKRFPSLGNGEINVLVCGKNFRDQGKRSCIVIDEILGRKAAEKLGLTLTGSIGLLKILKEKKGLNRNSLKEIIEKIKESPFRVDEEILRGLLE